MSKTKTARSHGRIKPKKQLPPNVIDGTEEDYCYVCGKLRWMKTASNIPSMRRYAGAAARDLLKI